MNEEDQGVDFGDGDSFVVDMDNVEDVSFEALPRGTYDVVIDECEFTYSQSKGNPMWSLTLEVTDGEYAGRKLFSHLVFSGPGLAFTKRQLGRIAPELKRFDPKDPDTIASILGKNIRAKVTIRKYEGEDRNNVRDLYAGEAAESFV